MKTALILTCYFPPAFDVGGKRAYRFARYLPDCGWRPVVVTAPVPTKRPIDPSPVQLPASVQVHRSFYPSWWPERTKRPSDGTVASPVSERIGQAPVGVRLKRQFAVPGGREALLAPLVGRQVAKIAKDVGADIVFASSSPYAALLYGRQVAKRTGLPLVLDLRDPWTLNFLHSKRAGWVQRAEQRLEERLFGEADRVTLTCSEASAAYRARYPELPSDRIHTIYNSFDPVSRPERGKAAGPLQLVHFGNCYGPRRMAPILRAIARLRDSGVAAADDVQIVNLGRPAQEDLTLASELNLEGVYSATPFVPYEEGLNILARADLQLLLAYGHETLFIPAKFFDYLLTGSSILCLSEPSELTELIERTRSGFSARPDDVEQVARIIADTLEAKRVGAELTTPDTQEIEALSSPVTARQLAALFDQVILERST